MKRMQDLACQALCARVTLASIGNPPWTWLGLIAEVPIEGVRRDGV